MQLENVLPGPARLLLVLPTEETVAKALRFGLAVWVIAQPHRHSAAWLRDTARSAEIVPVEGRDVAALAADVAQRHAVNYVLPTEFAAAGASAGRLLGDIAAIRRLFDEDDRAVVRSGRAASIAELTGLLDRVGFPTLVRSATAPAVLLRDHTELADWAGPDTGQQGPWLVEEYLTGPRFTVSTLTVDGMHHVVGISAWRQPDNAVVTGAGIDGPAHGWLHPAPLSSRDRVALVATATGLLDLADYEFGPAQVDVVLTGQGVRVVTARPRFASLGIPRLIELTTGFDPEIALLGALASEPIVPPVEHQHAATEFLPFPPEIVRSACESAEIADLPGVRELHLPTASDDPADPGQRGFLVVCGVSAADVERDTERIRRRLHAALHPF
jgi:hypothetical protein